MPGPQPTYAITLTSEQEGRLQYLSTCYMAPFATVQPAQLLLLAHRHPQWQNATLAQRVGCSVNTVKRWRQRAELFGGQPGERSTLPAVALKLRIGQHPYSLAYFG